MSHGLQSARMPPTTENERKSGNVSLYPCVLLELLLGGGEHRELLYCERNSAGAVLLHALQRFMYEIIAANSCGLVTNVHRPGG